ncbi:MAG TPA: PIN domain-containing protein [Candidatus Nanoarchaeia archaeon]|nr:PIN domain-containing protein [Candidatus Nanoarchaeia archaeon]
MIDETYFFDSYAIAEVLKQNESYKVYSTCMIFVTKLNLFETAYGLHKEGRAQDVEQFLNEASKFVTDFNSDIIQKAAEFRFIHKKQNLSMTDCIGYCLALKLGIKFLTGDKEFEHLPNVEFVK